MSAILKITDGTTSVSLINGPIYLDSWLPAIPDYKGGGVYADSPIGESRRIVYRQFESVTEAMSIKIANNTQDDTIRALRSLQALLESASNYWISPWSNTPVYLVAQASRESSARYATIIRGRIPNLGPVMSQPFTNCSTPVLDNLSLTIERNHWTPDAPGAGGSAVSLSSDIQHNVVGDQSFEKVTFVLDEPRWSSTGGPTTFEQSSEQVKRDSVSMKIVAAGAGEGILQDALGMDWTEPNITYTFTVWVYVTSGVVAAGISDDGAFTNLTSTVSTTTGEWEKLTVAGSVATTGMSLSVRSSGGAAEFYVDDARMYPRSGMTNSTIPSATEFFVSNKQREDGIGYIFLYDDGAWTDNLLYEAAPQIVMGRTNDNAVYFGIDSSAGSAANAFMANGGPFDNLVFNLSEAIGGTSVALVWEYHRPGGWSSIPGIVDRTVAFTEIGTKSVTWRPPTNWQPTDLAASLSAGEGSAGASDVEAYWVRLRKTAGTMAADDRPEITSPFPYTVAWPYVTLGTAASPLGGDLVASAKIKIKNYGGTLAQSLETEVAAQNDDTWFERPIDVNQSASTALKLGEDWTSGARFLGLPIEPSSTILSAVISLVSTTSGTGVVRAIISAHDVDDSGALNGYNLAAWDALPRTSGASDEEVFWNLEGTTQAGQILVTPDLSNVVQVIVDRSGWLSGNDMTIFIEEGNDPADPNSDAGAEMTFASYDNVTYDPPTLFVVWQDSQGGVWLNKCIAGVRDTARGSDFISHINMSDWQKQVGIKAIANTESYFNDNRRAAGNRLITIESTTSPWPVSVPFTPITTDQYNIIIEIDGVLAVSYIGDFRAFLRVSTDLGNGETADFSIAAQTGTSGIVQFGHTSAEFRFSEAVGPTSANIENNIIPIDLGLIKIPGNPLSNYNKLSLLISGRSSVEDRKLNIFDLILIPADEWIGEIATAAGNDNAVVSLESMYFDSVANEKRPVFAYHTTSDDVVKAVLSAFSQRVIVSHTSAQRMYFMFNTVERDDASITFGERSSPWAFTSVSVNANRKYLSLRGDDS